MRINNVEFNVELEDVLAELISQMRANGIPYIQKQAPTSTHIQICCPYHANGLERRPSAGIRRSDGIFHCFACGEVHSLPEVISYCLGHDDVLGKFGWNWLLKNFATIQVEERDEINLDFKRLGRSGNVSSSDNSIAGIKSDNNNNRFISEEELKQYRYYHPYWTKRGITDERIIELFDLGYDRNTDCITFPIRDINGNCLFVARRSTKGKYFNYPTGAEKPLYGIYELNQMHNSGQLYVYSEDIVICESMIDCLRLWQNGKYAVALNGLGSDKQFEQLNKNIPCRKYILATDSDKAGMRAREVLRKKIERRIITEYILPPGRKDIGECTNEEIKNLEEVF